MALLARRVEQCGKPLRMDHRLIFAAVEGQRREPGGAFFGETQGRAFADLLPGRRGTGETTAQRMVVVGFARRGLGGRSGLPAFRQLGAQAFGHAPEQRGEFELAHEARQRLGVRLAHQRLGERHLDRHVGIEDHQRPRQPRLIGESDQAFAPLRLGDLRGAGKQRVEVAIFVDQQRRGLDPDAGHAWNVVGGVADQRLDLDDLRGRHAEALHHLVLADHLVLHGVVHAHARAHELHQVLVGGDDGHVGAGFQRLARIGGDDVVGLVALLLDAGDVERLHRVADQWELRDEVFGHVGAVRLVVFEQLVAEGACRIVEDHREMGRRRQLAGLAQQLPQHGAEAVHGADGQPVRWPREGRQRVIGAEDIARAVDQIDVIAFCHRPAGGLFPGLSHCHDGGNIGIGGPPVSMSPFLIPYPRHARP